MLRRKFIGLATLAGAGGLTAAGGVNAAEKRTVVFRIEGFTCVTCAVGLEALLRGEKGVEAAAASYPDAKATVRFNPRAISEDELLRAIAALGFKATRLDG